MCDLSLLETRAKLCIVKSIYIHIYTYIIVRLDFLNKSTKQKFKSFLQTDLFQIKF